MSASEAIPEALQTVRVRKEEGVVFAKIAAPPMNLLGPELVRDLVSLIQWAEADESIGVLVFTSADPDYFISHVDVTRIGEYRQAAEKLTGEASLGVLFRYLSASRLITVAQIEGRVRGVGSEFALACDMRFGARESAILGQPEIAVGLLPGGGAVPRLARLIGRARALEVMLSGGDYDADTAERYGWINRAMHAAELASFVQSLAHRIAKFPAAARLAVKSRMNALELPSVDEFRRDSDLFLELARSPETQRRIQAAFKRGFQTHEGELDLAWLLGEL